jgi:hypothetical protein
MKFLFAVFMGLSLNAFADHHEGMDKKMESMSSTSIPIFWTSKNRRQLH